MLNKYKNYKIWFNKKIKNFSIYNYKSNNKN